jgi:hypothetical protein
MFALFKVTQHVWIDLCTGHKIWYPKPHEVDNNAKSAKIVRGDILRIRRTKNDSAGADGR